MPFPGGSGAIVITYEYPLNERIRTCCAWKTCSSGCATSSTARNRYEHHAALLTLFEMLEVASRADLKSDLLQELERQKQVLNAFRNNPDIDRGRPDPGGRRHRAGLQRRCSA